MTPGEALPGEVWRTPGGTVVTDIGGHLEACWVFEGRVARYLTGQDAANAFEAYANHLRAAITAERRRADATEQALDLAAEKHAAKAAALAGARARVAELETFVRGIRDGWDCDADAHRYGTACRCCGAGKLLPTDAPPVKP